MKEGKEVFSSGGSCKRQLMTGFSFPICPLIFVHRFFLIKNGKEIFYHLAPNMTLLEITLICPSHTAALQSGGE